MDRSLVMSDYLTLTNVLVTLITGVFGVILLTFLFKTTKNDNKIKNKKKHGQQVQEHVNKQGENTTTKQNRKKLHENRWQNKSDAFTHPWMLTNFKGHTGQVLNMDFSSNNKYLASNGEEDGDATSETSSFSDTNSTSSRPSSAEPDSPCHKSSLSRRQKRNLKKRPLSTRTTTTNNNNQNKRKSTSSRQLQEWLKLQLTELELLSYLKNFLLTSEEMLSLGYPVETSEGNIIIFKATDSPRVKESEFKQQYVLDVNAREFVPKSLRKSECDSGNCSAASSGNTSDSAESFESWEGGCDKKVVKNNKNNKDNKKKRERNKNEPLVHKLPLDSLDSHVEYAYVSTGFEQISDTQKVPSILSLKARNADISDEIVQFPFYTFIPSSTVHKHFKNMTFYDDNGRSYEQLVLHHPMYPEYNVSDTATTHLCTRCGSYFHMQSGIYIGYNMCHFHVGKARTRQGQLRFPCCNQPPDSKPCEVSTFHVWTGLQMGFNGPFRTFKKTKIRKNVPKDGNYGIYAVDCEMAYTDFGLEAVKVTVIGPDGRIVYESMIKPEHYIWDYNTYYSGITEKDLSNAKSLSQVQNDLMGFISANTILVGHGLENDLRALKIVHKICIDTSSLFPHHNGLPFKRGLKTLVRSYLNRNIQKDNQPHNSYEDAASCMELVLWKVRNDFRLKHT